MTEIEKLRKKIEYKVTNNIPVTLNEKEMIMHLITEEINKRTASYSKEDLVKIRQEIFENENKLRYYSGQLKEEIPEDKNEREITLLEKLKKDLLEFQNNHINDTIEGNKDMKLFYSMIVDFYYANDNSADLEISYNINKNEYNCLISYKDMQQLSFDSCIKIMCDYITRMIKEYKYIISNNDLKLEDFQIYYEYHESLFLISRYVEHMTEK